MSSEGIRKQTAAGLPQTALHGVRERAARFFSPERSGRSCVPSRQRILRTIVHIYVVVLVIANGLLLYLGGELVDLYVSSVELWAELARKHLELTL